MGESKIRFGTALLAVGALAVLLTTAIACSASDDDEAAPAAAAPAAPASGAASLADEDAPGIVKTAIDVGTAGSEAGLATEGFSATAGETAHRPIATTRNDRRTSFRSTITSSLSTASVTAIDPPTDQPGPNGWQIRCDQHKPTDSDTASRGIWVDRSD